MVVTVCCQDRGEQHERSHSYNRLSLDECPICGYPLLWCEWCNEPASCCLCGAFHSVECAGT